MKIVFLDASTVDRDDIDFSVLDALGEVTLHPTSTPDEALERVDRAEVVITNKVKVTADLLAAAPNIRLVVAAATGLNHIDQAACESRGVKVMNVAGYSTESVAQHVFAMLLELATRVAAYNSEVRVKWPTSPIFTRLDYPLFELAGKTLGIVGLGSIGLAVARIGEAFGMKVIAYQRDGSEPGHHIKRLPEKEFFKTADMVTLHCPLNEETYHFIDSKKLALMQPSSILINTGRGELVDEEALAEALRSKRLAAAGLDVLNIEPPPANHPLIKECFPNLIVTPHTAWSTIEARRRLVDGIVENVQTFKTSSR